MTSPLSKLLNRIQVLSQGTFCNTDSIISSLCFDSRTVKEGSLFFALPGTHVHGNTFISNVLDTNVGAIIYQDEISQDDIEKAQNKNIPLIHVENSRFSMSPIADEFFDRPSEKLAIIGITGTEGKSSTVFFTWQFLRACNNKAGFISTVQYSLGDDALANPEHQTTPEAPIIHEKLYQMVQNGCKYAVIEASSHGLSEKLNRLGDVRFDAVAFMNVTHEHLEFHKTFEQYRYDKANLFRAIDKFPHEKNINGEKVTVPSFGVVNLEDNSAQYFKEQTNHVVYGFTTDGKASGKTIDPSEKDKFGISYLLAYNIESNSRTTSFLATGSGWVAPSCAIKIKVPGAFNVYNAMAASIIVARIQGRQTHEMKQYADAISPVKGRMTEIYQSQPFEVIVDYAHTPSSFQTIFPPLRNRIKGKMICVFGSGGERDIKKRPEQGRIASKYCDIVILADEDPRNEDPTELLEMIAEGCIKEKDSKCSCIREESLFIIPDRKKAIRKAFSLAKKDDLVLLLGKAHENSIIYKDYVMPYDEITEAQKALTELNYI